MTVMPEALAAAAVDVRVKANEVTAALEAAVLLVTAAALQAPGPEAGRAEVTNLRDALVKAGAEMGRRYEMGAAAERQRIWNRPVTQRLELRGGYPDGVWACAGCGAQLTESTITHLPRCSEMGLAALIGEQP